MLDILLVNDDGFAAAGINVLFEALVEGGHNVTFVAPRDQQSGVGTLIDFNRLFQPREVENFAPAQWFVEGSPVETAIAGLDFILAGETPDLVISGINEGANSGRNVVISSGTVSAAVTALHRNIPAIAVSAETGASDADFEQALETGAEFIVELIAELENDDLAGLLPEGTGLNVNIPAPDSEIQGVAFTTLDEAESLLFGFGPLPPQFGGGTGLVVSVSDPLADGQAPTPGSEVEQLAADFITLTPIDGNWSAEPTVSESLEARLAEAPADPQATPLDILLVNDDGFDAEGITVLFAALTEAGHNVILVGPQDQQSGVGTFIDVPRLFQPRTIESFGPNQFFVDGSPREVTWAGLDVVLNGEAPDLVISGINEGENLGLDSIASGTVSAAVTALLRGVPAIAVSAGLDLAEIPIGNPSTSEAFEIGAEFVTDLLAQLQATQGEAATILPAGTGLSINIPVVFPEGVEGIQGVAFTTLDEITSFEVSFGSVSADGVGLLFAPAVPPTVIPPDSEGGQFLSGLITVTPIDGNWSAPAEVSAAIAQQLAAFAANFDPRDLVFGSPDGDEIDPEIGAGFNGINDLIFVGAGADLVDLTPVAAAISGNRVYGGSGDDELLASAQERLFGGSNDDLLDASVGTGGNRLYGGSGNDELVAGSGDRLFGNEGNDLLDASLGGNNRLYGGAGNDGFFLGSGDRALGGEGEDAFFVGTGGGNVLTGGSGADTFWIITGELPLAPNLITDFDLALDAIGLGGIGATDVSSLTFEQVGAEAIVFFDGTALARFLNQQADQLETSANFSFA